MSLKVFVDTEFMSKYCHSNPEYRLLKTVSGIGPIFATVILLETGSIERFPDVGHYASCCCCVGSVHVSNGKKKGEGNTKNGNWAYVEAANFAIRYCEPVRKFYQRKKTKRNSIVAIKAVAHKLIELPIEPLTAFRLAWLTSLPPVRSFDVGRKLIEEAAVIS
eukprot:gene26159-28581_t